MDAQLRDSEDSSLYYYFTILTRMKQIQRPSVLVNMSENCTTQKTSQCITESFEVICTETVDFCMKAAQNSEASEYCAVIKREET